TDNNNVQHKIAVDTKGEIKGHSQDGYPDDPAERTEAANEHVNQARRFAKYWVYRNCGYDTLEPMRNPDRIAQAAAVLRPLTPETTDAFFGDLYRHLRSIDRDERSPLELPAGVAATEAVYQQDVYLGVDEEAATAYADVLADPAVLELLEASVAGTAPEPDAQTVADAAGVDLETLPNVRDGSLVEAVSGVHIHWDDAHGQYHTQWGDHPALERSPDARIELFAFDPEDLDALREQLVRNLVCQVRDCYLTMGIAPPTAVRILGHGRHDASTWYTHYDFYEEYYDPDADIDTWYEEFTPSDAYSSD
ncbi:hypothetical protein, partial [Natronobiforma cellulositropha]|uniref:hypothetical protein n=1 Tax=Natronobiforma cellulositropha TaxID=1679076 RepID=UPI0021D5A78A